MQSLFDVLYKKIVETNEILIKSLGKMMMGGTIMNLKQLEYFSVVAQYGSINKAAQALYVSQPHLSHILQDLEEDIGTALLTRTKKGVQLTEEGRHFLQHSQKILGEMNQLQGLFHKQERSGNTFRVSMTKFSHTMESFIDILNQWSQEPELSFRLNEGSSMDVIADVESGYSDLGVLHFEYTPDSPFPRIFEEKKLEYRHLSEIRPHIVLSQNHPLLRVGHAPTLGEFRPYGFVRYIGEYEDFTYNLSINGVHYDLDDSPKIASVYGRASLLHLISATDFYTIGIQEFGRQAGCYGCTSIPIPDCDNKLEFGYIVRLGTPPCRAAAEFIKNLSGRLNGQIPR